MGEIPPTLKNVSCLVYCLWNLFLLLSLEKPAGVAKRVVERWKKWSVGSFIGKCFSTFWGFWLLLRCWVAGELGWKGNPPGWENLILFDHIMLKCKITKWVWGRKALHLFLDQWVGSRFLKWMCRMNWAAWLVFSWKPKIRVPLYSFPFIKQAWVRIFAEFWNCGNKA